MKFDEKTLVKIEEYIQAIDEEIGLSPKTIMDINRAISEQRMLVKKSENKK